MFLYFSFIFLPMFLIRERPISFLFFFFFFPMFLIRERPVSFLFFFFSPYVSYKGASCFFSFLFFFPLCFL